MQWLNEPVSWQRTADTITVSVDSGTDFWRETGYGYIRDSGHIYGELIAGDLDISVRVRGTFSAQFDQAGVMLRADDRVWLKSGMEFFEGRARLSTVLTLGQSSWVVTDLPEGTEEITLRVSRRGDAVEVRYLLAQDGPAELAALMYLPPGRELLAGVMCAAPEGPGFGVTFHDLYIAATEWGAQPQQTEAGWTGESAADWEREDQGAAEWEKDEQHEPVTGWLDDRSANWASEPAGEFELRWADSPPQAGDGAGREDAADGAPLGDALLGEVQRADERLGDTPLGDALANEARLAARRDEDRRDEALQDEVVRDEALPGESLSGEGMLGEADRDDAGHGGVLSGEAPEEAPAGDDSGRGGAAYGESGLEAAEAELPADPGSRDDVGSRDADGDDVLVAAVSEPEAEPAWRDTADRNTADRDDPGAGLAAAPLANGLADHGPADRGLADNGPGDRGLADYGLIGGRSATNGLADSNGLGDSGGLADRGEAAWRGGPDDDTGPGPRWTIALDQPLPGRRSRLADTGDDPLGDTGDLPATGDAQAASDAQVEHGGVLAERGGVLAEHGGVLAERGDAELGTPAPLAEADPAETDDQAGEGDPADAGDPLSGGHDPLANGGGPLSDRHDALAEGDDPLSDTDPGGASPSWSGSPASSSGARRRTADADDPAADWERLVAGSRATAWTPSRHAEISDSWPGPPLAAREQAINGGTSPANGTGGYEPSWSNGMPSAYGYNPGSAGPGLEGPAALGTPGDRDHDAPRSEQPADAEVPEPGQPAGSAGESGDTEDGGEEPGGENAGAADAGGGAKRPPASVPEQSPGRSGPFPVLSRWARSKQHADDLDAPPDPADEWISLLTADSDD